MSAAAIQPPPALAPLVSARRLSRDFGGSRSLFGAGKPPVRAVADVSLDVAEGEVLGVVGESGSGKSTLGRLLLRLIEPTEGSVHFDGQDLDALSKGALRAFRRSMQMIFQDPYASLNRRMTIGEALMEPLRLHFGLRRAEAEQHAADLLSRVGLPRDHLRRYPKAFSGGQKQRIAIARALASRPRFIVADEPVSALDVSVQAEVINLLQDLQKDLGLSLMFISHDLSVVEIVADRVMVLYLGRVMEVAPTEALFARPAHPYTLGLMQSAPGARIEGERLVLSGEIPSPSNPPSGCVFRTRCPFALPDCAAQRPVLRAVSEHHYKACIRDDLKL